MLKITINTDLDLTPKGKRTAKIVRHRINGKKCSPVIRCYVGTSTYMEKDLSDYAMVNEWLVGQK